MAVATHAVSNRSGPTHGATAAKAKSAKLARPKAQWVFDGGMADGGADLQTKMEVSQPEDLLEREADRVAAHVMQASPPPSGSGASKRDEDEGAHVQRVASPHRPTLVAADKDEEKPSEKTKVHRLAQDDLAKKVQRSPQAPSDVRAADMVDDREESPPRLARKAVDEEDRKLHKKAAEEDETKKLHRKAADEDETKKLHRKAADEDETKKLHRKTADEDEAKKLHRRIDDDSTTMSRHLAAKRLGSVTDAEGIDDEVDDEVDDEAEFASNPNTHARTSVAFDDRLRMARLQGGAPLPHTLRGFFEPRMHTSLDHVRVHVDNEAAGLAQSVNARAFTVGRHVFFAPGQFQPQTQQGQKLIAHELTHVLQQRGGLHSVQREVFDSSPRAKDDENEAQGPAAAAQESPPRTASETAKKEAPASASAPGANPTNAPANAQSSAAKLGEPLMPEPDMELSPGETTRLAAVEASAQSATATQADVPPAAKEVATAKEAAQQPKAEADGQARADVVEKLDQREPPSPEILELCDKIRRVIRSKRPPNEESLVNADPEAMAKEAGREQNSKVQGDVDRVGSAYDSVKTAPEGTPAPAAPMPETPAQVPATDIGAPRAVPDAVPAEGMSLDADVNASAKRMDDAGMNTEPAKLVQDGPIAAAREAQGELATKAMEDPAKVAAEQKAALEKANADMAALQEQAQAALAGEREHHVGVAKHGKDTAKKSEEELRKDLSERANGVFSKAQENVKDLLDPLTDTAMKQWDAGVKQLSTEFKSRLKRVADWIEQRHSGLLGAVVAFGDYIAGLPPWVVEEYDAAEKQFGDGICKLITDISRDVNTVVKACESIISKARQEITTIYTQDLPASLNSWAADQQQQFGAKLDKLQGDVTATRTDFNKKLVDQAAGAVQEARQQIHELRQAARGLLGAIEDAIDEFVKDPAKFIINGLLKLVGIPPDAFWAVVAKIQQVVADIANEPAKFANNLGLALKQGFQKFFANIGKHLLQGLITWLFSAMGDVGVQAPRDMSLRSMVTLFLQVMGISWPRIRKLIAKHAGEKNAALAEKVYSFVSTLMEQGAEGIFEMIKDQLDPKAILDAVLEAAKNYVIQALITQVAAFVVKLFAVPVGPILEAIRLIYVVLSWVFNNAARIFQLVETVVNGASDLMAGNVGGMASAVEIALATLIAPVIDFLADLIGLGGLPKAVAGAIKGLQDWVEGILDRVIGFLIEKAKALIEKLSGGKKEEPEKPDERTAEQKQADLDKATDETNANIKADPHVASLQHKLEQTKSEYRLTRAEIVIDKEEHGHTQFHAELEINPSSKSNEADEMTFIDPPLTVKPAFVCKQSLDRDEFVAQLTVQETTMNGMNVQRWLENRARFEDENRSPAGTKKQQELMQAEYDRFRDEVVKERRLVYGAAPFNMERDVALRKAREFVDRLLAYRIGPSGRRSGFENSSLADREHDGKVWENRLYGKATAHALDQIAGGEATDVRLAGAREDFSIGAQWRGQRINNLTDDVNKEVSGKTEDEKKTIRMNVKLFPITFE